MPKKFAKFAVVGVFNTLFSLLLFNVFIFTLGMGALSANYLATLITIVISFFLNAKFVFKKDNFDDLHSAFAKFLAVTLITQLIIQQLALLFFLDVFKFPGHLAYSVGHAIPGLTSLSGLFFEANTAKILAVGVSLMANFIAYDKFVFAEKLATDKDNKDYT